MCRWLRVENLRLLPQNWDNRQLNVDQSKRDAMSQNPYAAPMAEIPHRLSHKPHGPTLFRLGDLLVIDKRVDLPPEICLMSNTKASGTLRRKLSWHHPAVFLALLVNILIYAILAIVLSKKATIHIGLSDEWIAKRRWRIAVSWMGILSSLGAMIAGMVMVSQPGTAGEWGYLILFGLFAFLFAAIYGLVGARLVSPRKITDSHVFLKGAHSQFLARLPHWPFSI